jgi:hypothetical protein
MKATKYGIVPGGPPPGETGDVLAGPEKAPPPAGPSPGVDPKTGRAYWRPENHKAKEPPGGGASPAPEAAPAILPAPGEWLDVGRESHAKEERVVLRLYKGGAAVCFNFEIGEGEKYFLKLTKDFKRCRLVGGEGRKPGRKNGHCKLNIFQLRKLLPCTMTFAIDPATLEGARVEE